MPKSKRAKMISLTRTDRKSMESKKELVDQIHECCDTYSYIYVFNVENMRNSKLKEVRTVWRDSRFFFGKNKVTAIALGKGPEDEYKPGLHLVTEKLHGEVGLLFTNKSRRYVEKWFNEFVEEDYARTGNKATQTVALKAGPLPQFSHAIEPQLRKLGLPTELQRGVVTLLQDFTVCEIGQTLTPEQARILKLFGYSLANFHINMDWIWHNGQIEPIE